MTAHLEVIDPGPSTTVQDLGRPGQGSWGVSPSGAADRGALRLANRLVGNPESLACLEVTLGGLQVRASGTVLVALTGARCPAVLDGRAVPHDGPVRVRDGQLLALAVPEAGVRSYLAVRGGLAVAPVLGSCSTDLLGGLGLPPLRPGERIPIGPPAGPLPAVERAAVRSPTTGAVELRCHLGPRDDWFTASARDLLVTASWTARSDSSRTGVRLDGPRLDRQRLGELPPEGLVRGAIQVPPTGPPTLFLADHPVTGGYPVIAVVRDADVDLAAQVRAGQGVRLRHDEATAGGGR